MNILDYNGLKILKDNITNNFLQKGANITIGTINENNKGYQTTITESYIKLLHSTQNDGSEYIQIYPQGIFASPSGSIGVVNIEGFNMISAESFKEDNKFLYQRYLSLDGGTITGDLTINGTITGDGSGITNINAATVGGKSAEDFYNKTPVRISASTNPTTLSNGIYAVEGSLSTDNGYPVNTESGNAIIYVYGQEFGEYGYHIIKYVSIYNDQYIKFQQWDSWTNWITLKDADTLNGKHADEFYNKTPASIDVSINPTTLSSGIYSIEGTLSMDNGYPLDAGWTHGLIYVSGEGASDYGYKVIRFESIYNDHYIKFQQWGSWSDWFSLRDAATLGGYSANYFQPAMFQTIDDLLNVSANTIYLCNDAKNAPHKYGLTNASVGICICTHTGDSSLKFVTLVYIPTGDSNIFIANINSSSTSITWKKINDGGNAALLDGHSADYFAIANKPTRIAVPINVADTSEHWYRLFSTADSINSLCFSLSGVHPFNFAASFVITASWSEIDIKNISHSSTTTKFKSIRCYHDSVKQKHHIDIKIATTSIQEHIISLAISNGSISDNVNFDFSETGTLVSDTVDSNYIKTLNIADGLNADMVGGKTVSQLQNYNNLTNKPSSLPANGGNADTVDGKHSTDFVGSSNITSSVDWNTLTETGVFHIITTEGTNRPATNHGSLFVDNNVGTPYQIFIPDGNMADIYKRKMSGEWVNIGGCNYKKSVSFTVQTGSWFRFAKCKNNLASGVFVLAVNSNGGHSSISTFSVSQSYSAVKTGQTKITGLSHSSFNSCVTKVRLDAKYGDNVEQYIDFYLEGGSANSTGYAGIQFFGRDWEICDIESNNVITDYTTQEITL